MLDEVPLARAEPCGISEEFPHHVELVIAGEDLHPLLLARLLVPFLHYLRVVLQNLSKSSGREGAPPEVVRHDAVRIYWVSCPLIPALVTRKEPRILGHAL